MENLLIQKYTSFFKTIDSLGFKGAFAYYYYRNHRFHGVAGDLFRLYSKNSLYPLLFRPNTSDLQVFRQIFIDKEYSPLSGMRDVGLVIDCGAYTGFSAAYFLNHFRNCYLVAIEPDPENFAVMEKNLKPFNNRVRLINSAVWSHSTGLALSGQTYRDGQKWTRQVRECLSGEIAEFTGVDIGTLLKESGKDKISILKIDIEGAEAELFSRNYQGWINRVDAIVIELHDDSLSGKASDIFFNAVPEKDFSFKRRGEVIIAWKN